MHTFILVSSPCQLCEWLPWLEWEECSRNCGGGQQQRRRRLCCDVKHKSNFNQCYRECEMEATKAPAHITRVCNTICYNKGSYSFDASSCECLETFSGDCCEIST